MTVRIHRGDLPDLAHYASVQSITIDTETMGSVWRATAYVWCGFARRRLGGRGSDPGAGG